MWDRKKIIYVDDEDINLKLFKLNFYDKYSIFTTLFPLKALDIIKQENIEVIITDYKMPVMNGMELIEKIKESQTKSSCIILSGYLESEVVTDKKKIFKYIMKPYKYDEMLKCINDAFNLLKSSVYQEE